MGHPYEIPQKGNMLKRNLMTSPRPSLMHLYPTKMIRFLHGLQNMIIWSQVLSVVVLSLRYLLAGA